MCPHTSRTDTLPCSQCLGVVPHRIEQVGGELTIDGVTARPVEPPRVPFGRDFKRRRRP